MAIKRLRVYSGNNAYGEAYSQKENSERAAKQLGYNIKFEVKSSRIYDPVNNKTDIFYEVFGTGDEKEFAETMNLARDISQNRSRGIGGTSTSRT